MTCTKLFSSDPHAWETCALQGPLPNLTHAFFQATAMKYASGSRCIGRFCYLFESQIIESFVLSNTEYTKTRSGEAAVFCWAPRKPCRCRIRHIRRRHVRAVHLQSIHRPWRPDRIPIPSVPSLYTPPSAGQRARISAHTRYSVRRTGTSVGGSVQLAHSAFSKAGTAAIPYQLPYTENGVLDQRTARPRLHRKSLRSRKKATPAPARSTWSQASRTNARFEACQALLEY